MAVPDYQSLMLPLLKTGSDGNEHSMREVIETLAHQFGLNESDRDELLPSGTRGWSIPVTSDANRPSNSLRLLHW